MGNYRCKNCKGIFFKQSKCDYCNNCMDNIQKPIKYFDNVKVYDTIISEFIGGE